MAKSKCLSMGIRDYALSAIVGVLSHERDAPQPLIVDLCVEVEITQEGDDLDQTVSYADFAPVIDAAAAKEPQLLETLAEEVLDGVLALDPRIKSAEIEIRKPQAIKGASSAFVRQKKGREEG